MIFIFRFLQYLHYLWKAKNAHGIHSPFVFSLYNEVINKRTSPDGQFKAIQQRYFENEQVISFPDPKTQQLKTNKICDLAKRTWAGHSFSTFLIKLIEYLNVEHVLEAGTALGINASYLSHARSIKTIHTIEGAAEVAKKAGMLMKIKPGVHLNLIQGNVKDVFEEALISAHPQLIFLDADHRSETISFYMEAIYQHKKPVKCIVIHDIYWSPDMLHAWNAIVTDKRSSLTIDLFSAGLVFPDIDMEKQHFFIKF